MPQHVVVDGSNIATEGRDRPSLRQLNEAVMAFIAEQPDALITVVVDATFGHRIDSKEVPEFDEAVNNNELVAPPAGAIGRGDAFVLSIANKVNAVILTNDSYQEFHGQYDWLFDEGRLVGGKPVPHIGWVFVNRLPVRGPLSRKVTAEAKKKTRGKAGDVGTVRVGSPDASLPMPVPSAPPPGASLPGKRGKSAVDTGKDTAKDTGKDTGKNTAKDSGKHGGRESTKAEMKSAPKPERVETPQVRHGSVNDLLSFLTFVERHPAGTSVNAIVDHYSSHGAYVKVGEVIGYVPLRLMADPAPRSAREFMKVGEAITLVVDKFIAEKRSIDLAVPGMGTVPQIEHKPAKPSKPAKAAKATPSRPSKATKAAKTDEAVKVDESAAPEVAEQPAKQSGRGKKAAPLIVDVVAVAAPDVPATPSKRVSKKAAAAAAAEPVAPPIDPVVPVVAKKGSKKAAAAPAKKSAAKKAAPMPVADVVAPAAEAPVKKSPAKRAAKNA